MIKNNLISNMCGITVKSSTYFSLSNVIMYNLHSKKLNKINLFNNKPRYYSTISNSITDREFYEWLCGFIDAEGCFKIKPKFRGNKNKVHSFYFEFEIHLHIDDLGTLKYINDTLGIGKIYTRGNTCSFIVGNTNDLKVLLKILDQYPLNGVKYLDLLDFKTAFLLYSNREDKLTSELIDKILEFKNNMNTNRTEFVFNHNIQITPYYLLGLIEGDGTFSVSRNPIRPVFQILLTASQEPLLLHIREYLINNLGFNNYSKWSINNTSVISLNIIKAKGNAKPTILLEIRDISLLNNYFIPFLDKLNFKSKKLLDFNDFKLLCKAIYNGSHKLDNIKDLLLKLTYNMNDYRLTTYKGNIDKQLITNEELTLIKTAPVVYEHLSEGKVHNIISGKEDYSIFSHIFIIINQNNEEIVVKTIKEASNIVGVHYTTLSKKISTDLSIILINNFKVKRLRVYI